MIVVLGRPRAPRSRMLPGVAPWFPEGLCVAVARAAVSAGARVELVGSIDDDATGDAVVVALGRAGVGHAALLRQPPAHAALTAHGRGAATTGTGAPSLSWLDHADVELGLGYLVDFSVLVLAEPLETMAESAALDAAVFHGARVVAVVPEGAVPSERLAGMATVLESPDGQGEAFAALVGRFAAELDRGASGERAWAHATAATGWERRH